MTAVLVLSAGYSAFAQEFSEDHLKAAKAAMRATGATERMDKILPEVAAFTKAGLIASRPDIEAQISATVDEVAIELAARRGPLEDEAANIYAKLFSQEELEQITSFFADETGKKFLRLTPALFSQVDRVSKVWRAGILRDMGKTVQSKLDEAGVQ